MHRGLALAGFAFLAAAAPSVAEARDQTVVIGKATLDPASSGTTIDVSTAPGAYRGIRVGVKRGATTSFTKLQFIFSDGTTMSVDKPFRLEAGERTRAYEESGDRFIDKVVLGTTSGGGKAEIEILGVQTRAGARMSRAKPASGIITGTATPNKPSAATPGTADGNDVMFGYQNVGFAIDRDVIKVGGDVGKFGRIRLRVIGNEIHIDSLKVVYVDGQSEDIAIDADVKASTKTPWFDLRRNDFIREIQMVYRSKPNLDGQARVEVTGQYADRWLGTDGEGRNYNEGWVLLGAQTAGFTGFDRDTITVGENEGGFTRLRVTAKDRAITLREVRVKYFSGPDEVFSMNERVDPEKSYGPLEFKGGKAPIKVIEARYRSRYDILKGLRNAFEGGPAVVQIWGQH